MGLHGFHLDVMLGACRIRKVRENPTTRHVPASRRKMAKPRMAKSARIAERNLKKGAHVEVTVTAKDVDRDN